MAATVPGQHGPAAAAAGRRPADPAAGTAAGGGWYAGRVTGHPAGPEQPVGQRPAAGTAAADADAAVAALARAAATDTHHTQVQPAADGGIHQAATGE